MVKPTSPKGSKKKDAFAVLSCCRVCSLRAPAETRAVRRLTVPARHLLPARCLAVRQPAGAAPVSFLIVVLKFLSDKIKRNIIKSLVLGRYGGYIGKLRQMVAGKDVAMQNSLRQTIKTNAQLRIGLGYFKQILRGYFTIPVATQPGYMMQFCLVNAGPLHLKCGHQYACRALRKSPGCRRRLRCLKFLFPALCTPVLRGFLLPWAAAQGLLSPW